MVTTVSSIPRDLQSLLSALKNLSVSDQQLIEKAYYYAENAHQGMVRNSGEPYFTHCVAVATILAELHMDAETIAAGLLHDVVEDTRGTPNEVTEAMVEAEFGSVVCRLVSGLTKLKKMAGEDEKNGIKRSSMSKRDIEYLRRMMLTADKDIRVVIVKLADRLHNMRTLGYMKPEKQLEIAQETMEIYAPLANRLGIWQMKWELEDLALRYLEPEAYKKIANALAERRADREAYMAEVAETLRKALEKHGITNANISARPKHITSIWRKMERKGIPLEQVYDVRAMRVIVQDNSQCYIVLGIVHDLWKPIPGEFDDYIGNPKDNFYRSLHTAVMDNRGRTLEVQIRTWEMHEHAEYGIAAHWRYKEGRDAGDERFEKYITYLRRLMEFGNEVESGANFMEAVEHDFLANRIFVFTPKGKIIDLPRGATPLDFAYSIHTEIGNRCRGAKVRGKLVPLNYQLKMGDQVEILTSNRGGPSLDWLNPDNGYAITSRAKSKIKHYFRRQQRESNISSGRQVLEHELKKLGLLERVPLEAIAALFDYSKLDDFLYEIGVGNITGSEIAQTVLEDERKRREAQENDLDLLRSRLRAPASQDVSSSIFIDGTGGMLVTLARCCSPLPGEDIIGYTTRGRGITVHRASCSNVQNIPDPERLIEVSWGTMPTQQRFNVPVEIVAHDRTGLLRDITTVISESGINISSVEVHTKQAIASIFISLEIGSPQQLTKTLAKIENIPSVVETRRRLQT
ncbi:bifunctional (p)ppGpp synthetase/guanosine-3',5'-bis(diphosphate) 3'-pyrophosphohydrolase [Aggregatilineales bacterium SYSU G02658]